jgi:hypothetical protein
MSAPEVRTNATFFLGFTDAGCATGLVLSGLMPLMFAPTLTLEGVADKQALRAYSPFNDQEIQLTNRRSS